MKVRLAGVSSVVVAAAVTLTWASGVGLAQMKEFGLTGDSNVLALLRKARAHRGSAAQIASVKSLGISGMQIRGDRPTDRTRFRYLIVFPDAYRSESDVVTTVLTKHHYWRSFHQPVPLWNPTPNEDKEVRRRTLLGFVETCLTTLLRAPELSQVRARGLGHKTTGGMTGDVIEFEIVEGGTLEFFLQPHTGKPIGFVSRGRKGGEPGQVVLRVERFVKHESVAGIQVPVVSEQVFIGGTASGKPQTIERRVVINPPAQPRAFEQPPPR